MQLLLDTTDLLAITELHRYAGLITRLAAITPPAASLTMKVKLAM